MARRERPITLVTLIPLLAFLAAGAVAATSADPGNEPAKQARDEGAAPYQLPPKPPALRWQLSPAALAAAPAAGLDPTQLAPAPVVPGAIGKRALVLDVPASAQLPGRHVAEPLDGGDEGASPLARWLANHGVTRAPAAGEDETGGLEQAISLSGSNFPICNVATDVSNTEALDRSSIAYSTQSGSYMVVWHATTRASRQNVYGRVVAANGTMPGVPMSIGWSSGMELSPSIAYDSAPSMHQYWVAWTDLGTGSTGNIHLRRVSTTGNVLGNEIIPNDSGPIAFGARVACGAGRCVVVWTSDPGDGNSHILFRAYDSSGNALTPVYRLSDDPGKSTDPDIAYNSTDQNFLVVWNQQQTPTGLDVKSLGLTKDFYSFSPQTISAASYDQKVPRISYSAGAGRYLVTWYDARSQQSWDVWGHLVGRDGAALFNDFQIRAGTYTDAYPVVAGSDTASQFMVAYQSDISGASQFQIFASTVSGAGGVGSPFQVRVWYNYRSVPAIALRPGANEYLVTFTDNGSATQPDIDGQLVTGSATLAGSLVVVARGRKGQEIPRLAYDSTHDEYLALWADYRSGSDYDIYARRVSAAGELLGSEIVPGSETVLYGYPSLAYDARADEYLAVWQEVHTQQSGYEIYARRIGWSGDLRGAAFLVSRDTATPNEGSPRVVYNPTSDEYLVAWHAFTNTKWRTYAQRVSPAGALVGSNFVVSASTGDTQNPHVAWNKTRNEYLLVWQDNRNTRFDIFGQRISAAGALLGGNIAVSTVTGSKDGCDAAYSEAANDYLVVWGDARTGGNDVYGQRLDATGNISGADFAIANADVGETAPVAVYDAVSHGFLVAYWKYNSASDWDVWARMVPGAGLPSEPGLAIANSIEVQSWPEVAQNSRTGQFLAAWQDFRSGRYNIYGQLINNPGACTYALSSTSQSFAAAGGNGNVVVTAPSGCAWTATSNAAWITVTGGASGPGNGIVTYSVGSNSGGARTGTLTIAGQTFTVSQTSQSCTYSLSASSASFTTSGGNGTVGVTTPSGCPWTASTGAGWIHITSGSGTGSGTLSYTVDANSGSARSGTITVQSATLTVNQAGSGTSLAYAHWIAAVSHTDGTGGSHWRSDVAVLNRSSSQATVEYRLYTPGGVSTQQVVLPGNAQDFHTDIAAWLGYLGGSGPLEVRSSQDVFVMGRTYNQVDATHTYGQNYDGQEIDSGLLSAGQSAWLPLLAQNSAFRCNIAITNAGTGSASVTLTLYDGQGAQLWSGNTESSTIPAGGFVQYLQPFQKYAGRSDLEHAYAKVTVDSGSSIMVWASVVDGRTGDPTTIFMKR